jgi:16S rRNA processing protein RimM
MTQHAAPPVKPNFVCVGVIVGAHGIKGEVRIKSFTAIAENITAYGTLYDAREQPVVLKNIHLANQFLLAGIKGITTRTEAEKQAGTYLYAARAKVVKEGEVLLAELIGLPVKTPDGADFGVVKAIYESAHLVLEIATADGLKMVPFVPSMAVLQGDVIILTSDAAIV